MIVIVISAVSTQRSLYGNLDAFGLRSNGDKSRDFAAKGKTQIVSSVQSSLHRSAF